MNQQIKPPTSFWVIACIGLVWNLMGVGAFVSDMSISTEALATLQPAQRALYETMPMWVKAAYGIAVICGVLGCIALLMRKSIAVILFLISMIGIMAQFGYNVLISKSMEVYGPGAIIMPVVVIFFGFFLIWHSKKSRFEQWIS